MRRLVEHDEVVGVVRDGHLAGGRVEDPGVPAGRPADGLAHDQRLVIVRPFESDPLAQCRQPGREQPADALAPCHVVGP